MFKKFLILFVMTVILIWISACNPQAWETNYEMNYYGREITSTTGNIQDTYVLKDYQGIQYEISLSFESAEKDGDKEFLSLVIKTLDRKDCIVFSKVLSGDYLSSRIPLPRAEFNEQNHLIVYFENWRTHLVAGYVNGTLAQTDIFEFDINQGAIINSWQGAKDEFVIKCENEVAYIFKSGNLYTRNLKNWANITFIEDLGLDKINADEIQTLFFDVNDNYFSIYKSMQQGLNDFRKTKELLITVSTDQEYL